MVELRAVLKYDNPNKMEYAHLSTIQKKRKIYPNSTFGFELIQEFRAGGTMSTPPEKKTAFREYLRGKLAGEPLVELGCGHDYEKMANFAKEMGASAYIGIDLGMIDDSERTETDLYTDYTLPTERSALAPMKIALVSGDMLEFISQLSMQSNIAICGLDCFALGLHDRWDEYSKALVEEMARVVRNGGIVFGTVSEVYHYLSRDARFKYLDRERFDETYFSRDSENWVFERTG